MLYNETMRDVLASSLGPLLALALCGACQQTTTSTDAGADQARPAEASVRVQGGQLLIDGQPTFLYGGEVHYFRVRDPGFDVRRTQALWRDTIQRMSDAHMNLLTTYFPWDYHAPADGVWDFSGARDVDAFLGMVCDAGFKVVAKPGPFITAEWPGGFGSYGAAPLWWKQAHPDALVKGADGKPFTFSPTGDAAQAQPSYLHPEFQQALAGWFDHIVPIIQRYIDRRCIVAVQVDNETNLFWSNRFGAVDYNPVAVAHFRAFLQGRYGDISRLNAARGTAFQSFAAVPAPPALPATSADNVAARDWYDAGQAYILDYLKGVRAALEARGLREPTILFTTNDSPFGLPTRNLMVHDGRVKNQVGLAGLDLYPKQLPTNGDLNDYPFQADYFTKLFTGWGALYSKDSGGRFAYAAELQGGFYDFPLGIHPTVTPESTEHLLAKAIGHGVKGGAFYVLRGGLNLDGSSYDFQAAISLEGALRPRYEVLKRWGALLSRYGAALESADEIEDAVAIAQDVSYAAPQAGTNDDLQALYTTEYNGLFGWLINAGFNPQVVDLQTAGELRGYKAVVTLVPQLLDPGAAGKLLRFHEGGGVLVQLLSPGQRSLGGAAAAQVPELARLAALYPVTVSGTYTWPGLDLRAGAANLKLSGAPQQTQSYWHESFFTPVLGGPAKLTPLLVERQQPLGGDGRLVGFSVSGDGAAPRALLGTHLGSVYNHHSYYSADAAELTGKRALLRSLLSLAGLTPILSTNAVREEVWARRARGGPLFLFVVNDHDAGTIHLNVGDLLALGLSGARSYQISDALSGQSYSARSGEQLLAAGLDVRLARYGVAVLVVE